MRSSVLSAGNLSLNPNKGIVVSDGEEISLTAKEYQILKTLLENKGKVVSRQTLIDNAWGYEECSNERSLDTHMKNLRKALGANSKLIKTVVGRGYRIGDNL